MFYFVITDVHSYYDQMKAALDEAGFDENNPNHTLISLGDAIDRGPRPNEVIKYLVNLPRKILIRGNHEDLLQELLDDPWGPKGHDITNGTYNTAVELASKHHKINYGTNISKTYAKYLEWCDIAKWAKAEKTYRAYDKLLVDYAEIGKYIFVHGWIPCFSKTDIDGGKKVKKYKYNPNWKNADYLTWCNARWESGIDCTINEIFVPNKVIVCGHWHATAWHEHFEKRLPFADNTPYIGENVIALDACTAYTKKVNVFVFEMEENGNE